MPSFSASASRISAAPVAGNLPFDDADDHGCQRIAGHGASTAGAHLAHPLLTDRIPEEKKRLYQCG